MATSTCSNCKHCFQGDICPKCGFAPGDSARDLHDEVARGAFRAEVERRRLVILGEALKVKGETPPVTLKYVVYKVVFDDPTKPDEQHVILFPKHLVHKSVAQGIVKGHMNIFGRCTPVSAGSFENNVASGYSESLKLHARLEDTTLIREEYGL